MTTLTNLWPNPKFATADGPTVLAYNYFHNPSPVSALTQFTAAGTATIELDATSAIKGAGGVKVTSPDGTSGIQLTLSEYDSKEYASVSVYVRAREAMTITGSATGTTHALHPLGYSNTFIGWGEYGWGETYSMVAGASHTFAAGEVKRFRMNARVKRTTAGGTWNSSSPTNVGYVFKLAGDGEFDIDAVMHVDSVTDGVDPADYPGGIFDINNMPPYFSGATAATNSWTHDWTGTANASRSRRLGTRAKYALGWKDQYALGGSDHDNARQLTLAGGETAVAIQSDWEYNSYGVLDFLSPTGTEDLTGHGLVSGTSYVLSWDIVSLYENYIEGTVGGLWDNFYCSAGVAPAGGSYDVPAVHPLRKRIHIGFTATGAAVEAYQTVYRNYVTGESAITSMSLIEVDFVGAEWSPNGTYAPLDLLAYGLEAGGTYTAVITDGLLTVGQFYRVEYQTGGGGAWTTLDEALYDAAYVSQTYELNFTAPANVTALRMSTDTGQAASNSFDAQFFSTPPEYFDGDTTDGGGYTYSWAGTPGDSASIRTPAPSTPNAKVFVAGAAVTVTAMRVVVNGTLVNVTEAGD
jgi:hypothetical protein